MRKGLGKKSRFLPTSHPAWQGGVSQEEVRIWAHYGQKPEVEL